MHNVKILDCTLRDGGYYNNWDFSTNLSKNYLKTCNKFFKEIKQKQYNDIQIKKTS